MTTTDFLQLVTNGIVQGSMYGLIAVGYTMVYGIIQLINFAHGEIFMFGGFGALAVYLWIPWVQHIPLIAALPLMLLGGMTASVLIAMGAERFAYRPLRTAPRLAPLITAIGLSFVLQQLVFLWYPQPAGGTAHLGVTAAVPFPNFSGKPFSVGGVLLQRAGLLTVVVAVLCMAYLAYFVSKTRTGRAMQATAQDPDTARLMGIDTDRVIVVAFVLGGAFAAVAAITYGLRFGQVTFDMGFSAGLKAFTAAVLGGIGNVYGAMVGGLVLGIAEVTTSGVLADYHVTSQWGTAWQDVWAFVLLIIVLLVRPQGLLGERVADRA
ncbi:MAG TPA: branched-chain amino acid ABC transporter permease [Actinocrinis sp.]|uniref:branched-chain amino acid ABC transporter permease n=1 Tax=Actinocrinis sp. TaxID=1920516 RepID=UPI002DDDB3E1|nr:branched-chain amino acid ABC transporter permease [Actinocrinis sp.]HEV2347174.1 branched-chain amino acid ABC transporter permease [Actinocrinis sp.]